MGIKIDHLLLGFEYRDVLVDHLVALAVKLVDLFFTAMTFDFIRTLLRYGLS